MNWFNLTIIALGLILGYAKNREQSAASGPPVAPGKTEKAAGSKSDKPWRSDSLDDLIDASKISLDPLQRHMLLAKIITKIYPQRSDVRMKKIFQRFARMHLAELPELAPVLKSEHGGSLPAIPTFKLSAIVFEEEENYEAAMAVCQMALELGIDDGTKSGFSGRLKRLQKKQQRRQA
ncbi:MAG: hypothetical protein PVG52_06275 [Desulfobacterales bacterium]|jgi:hypothetical protein